MKSVSTDFYKRIGQIGGMSGTGDSKRHGHLTWEKVRAIRQDPSKAQEYGLNRQHVYKILTNRIWVE